MNGALAQNEVPPPCVQRPQNSDLLPKKSVAVITPNFWPLTVRGDNRCSENAVATRKLLKHLYKKMGQRLRGAFKWLPLDTKSSWVKKEEVK